MSTQYVATSSHPPRIKQPEQALEISERKAHYSSEEEANSRCSFNGLVYASAEMHSLITSLKSMAAADVVILVLGETGTGKELVARAIHQESTRRTHPFVPFNCSALSRELIETRLFGHRRGAFTGACSDEPGVIRSANGGTVFLDEIGELTLEAQGALLRFLDSREIQPVGSPRPVTANVRVVCATNRDLRAEVEAGRFRQDLYFRLNVATLFVPPLFQRGDDVRELTRHFAQVYSKKFGKPEPVFGRKEMSRLVQREWPGNVRELESYIKRRIILGDVDLGTHASRVFLMTRTQGSSARRVSGSVLPVSGSRASSESPSRPRSGNDPAWRSLSKAEKYLRLNEALKRNRGNVTKAAQELGICRETVQRLRRKQQSDES